MTDQSVSVHRDVEVEVQAHRLGHRLAPRRARPVDRKVPPVGRGVPAELPQHVSGTHRGV